MKNTLYIKTDLKEQEWLQYVLIEFKRTQIFYGDIKIVNIDEILPSDAAILYYTKEHHERISIINKAHSPINEHVFQIGIELYVMPASITKDDRFILPYDLFWNAFIFLSRLEEFQAFKKRRKIASHCVLHPRTDKSTFAIPIVNILFEKLEDIIHKEFKHLLFGISPPPTIDLAHDVDYLSKSPSFMVKQSILNVYDIIRSMNRFKDCTKNIHTAITFLFNQPNYWCFEYWEALEKKMNTRSIFYVHAKSKRTKLTSFIDPNYDIAHNQKLRNKLRQLISDGFSIGLHGSYHSATNQDLLEEEKIILENAADTTVTHTRQHWLRYVENKTPLIHEKLFTTDSTLGWNDRVGFRNGIASPFHPYDHIQQRPLKQIEIPQVIMDFNIYQSLCLERIRFVNRAIQMLERSIKYKSVQVSISWHLRACTTDYQWQKTYEHILKEYKLYLKPPISQQSKKKTKCNSQEEQAF